MQDLSPLALMGLPIMWKCEKYTDCWKNYMFYTYFDNGFTYFKY